MGPQNFWTREPFGLGCLTRQNGKTYTGITANRVTYTNWGSPQKIVDEDNPIQNGDASKHYTVFVGRTREVADGASRESP